jgi:hypothetical protein
MPGGREEFFAPLKRILQDNAHANLEADEIEFVAADNPAPASVTAIRGKIVAAAIRALLISTSSVPCRKGPARQFLGFEELAEGPGVRIQLSARRLAGTTDELRFGCFRNCSACSVGTRE